MVSGPAVRSRSIALSLALACTMLLFPQALRAGLADAEMQKRLKSEGATPVGDTPAEFTAFVRQDIERWAPIVKASGATPN